MGIAFKDIIIAEETSLDSLHGKILAVDSFNMLYQFLTTIRSRDGTPLMDSNGNVTSHLVGLFSRTTKMMQKGLRPVFVFDGKPPELKKKERERRAELKAEAKVKYEDAKQKENLDEMRKYAGRTAKLSPEMIEEAKKLVSALGLPVVQAPSEGEAQAAFMAKQGDAFAVISQDFDSMVHGAPKIVRNLSLLGKRKKVNKLSYEIVKPELIDLSENLNNLGVDQNQLIVLAMLVGTDYNIGGVKGIGPKNALKLVKKHGTDFDALFKEVNWKDSFDTDWNEVYGVIKNMETTTDYNIEFTEPNREQLRELLVEQHDFSDERINRAFDEFEKGKKEKAQKGLSEFF